MVKANPIVVDSSVAIKWITSENENLIEKANQLISDCKADKVNLYAPELAKYEIGNAILKKGFTTPISKASLETLFVLPIEFIPQTEDQAKETMEIAYMNKITFYDASFIALAQELNAKLVTDNPKRQKKFKGVSVISLQDYK